MTDHNTLSIPEASLARAWDPQKPATRVYISGYTYKLVAPSFIRPPLINTVKAILNWAGPAGKIAKNIFYLLFPTGVDTTVPSFLTDTANQIMTNWATNVIMSQVSNVWNLQSATVKDNGSGSGAVGTSTHAPIPGTGASVCLPPQVAIVISWPIAASYRGGKPRWYLPGVQSTAENQTGDSTIAPSTATSILNGGIAFRTAMNSSVIDTFTPTLGTISYLQNHTPRPTPLFRAFLPPRVHERLDSQRRRSGKESGFASIP